MYNETCQCTKLMMMNMKAANAASQEELRNVSNNTYQYYSH